MGSTASTPAARDLRAGSRFVWRASGIAGLSGILFGYDASSINDAIEFLQRRFHLTSLGKGVVVGALTAGAAIGAIAAGTLADRFGRKRVIIGSGLAYIAGIAVVVTAPDQEALILGRIVIGVAIGFTSAVTPLYISEVAPANRRGGMVALYQLAITVGILIAFIAGAVLEETGNWRLMIGLAVVPAAIQMVAMTTVPESPRYLLHRGRRDEARDVLTQIRGDVDVDAELGEIDSVMRTESSSSWADLFSRGVRPALYAGLGLALIQAFTGINAVMYYSTNIFALAGFSGDSGAEIASVAVGVVNVATTILAIRLVNRYGRRPLLMAGLFGMISSLAVGGITLLLPASHVTGWITLVATLSFVASFAFSLGPIAWIVIGEIFPLSIRGRAASFATSGNWAANLVIAVSFPAIVGTSQSRVATAFFLYALVGIVSVFFIGAKVPETRNRTLEEIEADLSTGFTDLRSSPAPTG